MLATMNFLQNEKKIPGKVTEFSNLKNTYNLKITYNLPKINFKIYLLIRFPSSFIFLK